MAILVAYQARRAALLVCTHVATISFNHALETCLPLVADTYTPVELLM